MFLPDIYYNGSIVIQKKNQVIDFVFPKILEVPRVVPRGDGKMSVCMYVRGARAQTVLLF